MCKQTGFDLFGHIVLCGADIDNGAEFGFADGLVVFFLATADGELESGRGNQIPLWLLGFLY